MQQLLPDKHKFITYVLIFIILAGSLAYFIRQAATPLEPGTDQTPQNTQVEKEYMEGTISYKNPDFYPNDEITHVLTNEKGKEIILLKAKDQMLFVSEGFYAKVYGAKTKTVDGKEDVLIVEKVIVQNGTN